MRNYLNFDVYLYKFSPKKIVKNNSQKIKNVPGKYVKIYVLYIFERVSQTMFLMEYNIVPLKFRKNI